MKAICVDDESLILQLTVSMCRDLQIFDQVEGFSAAAKALKWLENHPADIALLDIDMPGMNGLLLAREIKDRRPDTAVIFLTGYAQYAVDAFALRASGYLLKPISKERLKAEIEYALSARRNPAPEQAHISVRTFGGFEVYVDGSPVFFDRARSKELLAFLVDRQGGRVTRAEAFSVLWEDALYDRPMQKQMDVMIRSLRKTLDEYGIGEMMQVRGGSLRVVPETFDCDLYRFLNGDMSAVNAYRGEYMNAYSWASLTEGHLTSRKARS